MSALGINEAEIAEVLAIEAIINKDSMRPLSRHVQPLQSYPINWYNFRDLQVFQSIPLKGPNIRIVNVERGCGRPGPPFISSPCLARWNKTEIFMYRMREWNTPPYTHKLPLEYGTLPEPIPRGPSPEMIQSIIVVPISQKLDELLEFLRQRGPHVEPRAAAAQIEPAGQAQSTTRPRASSLPERPATQQETGEIHDGVEETMAAMETMQLSEAELIATRRCEELG